MRIIANPSSRRGRGEKMTRLVTDALASMGIEYELSITSGTLHATEIARGAAGSGEELVLCVGGDGTVSEVAGGLCGSDTVLGIIPAGTGDDFARYMGIPSDALKALDIALNGSVRTVDVGLANGRTFVNVAGSGFDVAVLRHTLFYKKIFHGLVAYIFGLFRALADYRPMDVAITYNGGTIKQKCLIAGVANGRYFGGGMCFAPKADASDGLFDVHYVDHIPRWKIPFLLAGFVGGAYVKWPVAHHFRANGLTVTTSDASLQLDGEILSGQTVRYELLPGSLKVKAPR